MVGESRSIGSMGAEAQGTGETSERRKCRANMRREKQGGCRNKMIKKKIVNFLVGDLMMNGGGFWITVTV